MTQIEKQPGTFTRLVVPLPPNMANDGRVHWRRKYNAQQEYFDTLDLLLAARRIPAPPREVPGRVRLTAHLFVWSEMDDDNALARLKHALDWLRTRGYVADDRRRNIEWTGLPQQTIDRRDQRLELIIEPVEVGQ